MANSCNVPRTLNCRRRGLVLAAAALMLLPLTAAAAEFPQRPVRIVVPYAPGGGTDVVARVLANTMASQITQPVVVENRTGAAGLVGAEAVARSDPDGHTILFTNTGFSVLRVLSPDAPIDVHKELTPVAIVAESPMIMMVANNVEAKTLPDFLKMVRANPGKFDYGSTGTGGTNGLTALMFIRAAGLDMNEIPYRGGAPATQDLAGGRIAMLFDASSTALQTTRSGQARALAVTTPQRSPSAPELPTLQEAGVPASMSIWMGLFVPSATPEDQRNALHGAISKALKDTELQRRFREFGTDRIPEMSPAESVDYVADEVKRWEDLLRSALEKSAGK